MIYWKQIVKFTLWYFCGLIITGIANYLIFGGAVSDSVTVESANLFAFIIAATFTSTPHAISQAGFSVQNAKSFPVALTIWTLFIPMLGLMLATALLLIDGQNQLAQATLLGWLQASPVMIFSAVLGQAFDAMVVYLIVKRSFDNYIHSENS